ncbi:hypothetical protein GGQ59_000181 [Parvularcula dongshanensis]|uniref:Uncharacterized protein n=2 Tax=Parvularcula dongshanensis TaxID=1173995 RepID=A0A840I070_9PROT|nr:hypothetical protein [Parvularcula dongshanensis]
MNAGIILYDAHNGWRMIAVRTDAIVIALIVGLSTSGCVATAFVLDAGINTVVAPFSAARAESLQDEMDLICDVFTNVSLAEIDHSRGAALYGRNGWCSGACVRALQGGYAFVDVFDLARAPGEQRNLALERPENVRRYTLSNVECSGGTSPDCIVGEDVDEVVGAYEPIYFSAEWPTARHGGLGEHISRRHVGVFDPALRIDARQIRGRFEGIRDRATGELRATGHLYLQRTVPGSRFPADDSAETVRSCSVEGENTDL